MLIQTRLISTEWAPAWRMSNRVEIWQQNGLRHRLDGPAVLEFGCRNLWYRDGQYQRVTFDGAAWRKYWDPSPQGELGSYSTPNLRPL